MKRARDADGEHGQDADDEVPVGGVAARATITTSFGCGGKFAFDAPSSCALKRAARHDPEKALPRLGRQSGRTGILI
jgi:hypothetical protein